MLPSLSLDIGGLSVDYSDVYIKGTTYFANNVANLGGGEDETSYVLS